MRILADTNIPEEHVSALRGDGHEVAYSRSVTELGPEATDDAILRYAESARFAVLTADAKDFGNRAAAVPVFVVTQEMAGGDVRSAIERIAALPFDPAESEPLWLSGI